MNVTKKSERGKMEKFVYLGLIFSILNACLRLTDSGATSIYRLYSPVVIIFILYANGKAYAKDIFVMGGAFLYSGIVSLIFYQHISINMWVFAFYIFFLYILVKYLFLSDSCFEDNFWGFLHGVTVVSMVLAWIQFFVRIPYPYLELAHPPGVNIFMGNENELAVPWGCMFNIYLYKTIFEKKKRFIVILINILFFLFINDAKLTLIGLVVSICAYFVFWLNTTKVLKTHLSAGAFVLLVLIGMILGISILVIWNPTLIFRNYKINLSDLLFNKIKEIILLKPTLGSGGSLVDRTNVIIFGLIELKNTFFLGIGWGNSILMLEKPQYYLMTAKSMHNIIAQFLTEFGIVAIVVYGIIVRNMWKGLKRVRLAPIYILKITFVISFIFISSQSSVGILSNYYMWISVFYVIFLRPDPAVKGRQDMFLHTGRE